MRIFQPSRLLVVAACASMFVFVVAVSLHEYLYTFDPYSWAFPGIESDKSRSLWLHRRDLYRIIGLISFVLAVMSGVTGLVIKLRNRKLKLASKNLTGPDREKPSARLLW